MMLIKRDDVIGQKINQVFHVDLPYKEKDRFQERLIVIELETGLQFTLEQELEILDANSQDGMIYSYTKNEKMTLVLNRNTEKNLNSPIKETVIPYTWTYNFGLVLENGFVLHDGFSSWENGHGKTVCFFTFLMRSLK
jgi:hypothetical protein